ncbi:MAG: hypothetical protein KDB03_05315 [Planctomycetales bacterium]|nr:hypothetical protein [Planctomycetales bacterium]
MTNCAAGEQIKKTNFLSVLITQSIAIFGFVLVPAFITFIAPVSTIELERASGQVHARTWSYVLLFVPALKKELESVTSVQSRASQTHSSKPSNAENKQRKTATRLAEGELILENAETKLRIQADPTRVEQWKSELETFLNDDSVGQLRQTVYADWRFTYLLGGTASAFSALYLFGAVLASLRWMLRAFIRGRAG